MKKDFLSSCFLFCLGLFLAVQSTRLLVWGKEGPGPGFFPLLVAIIIVGISISIVIETRSFVRAKAPEKISESQREEVVSIFKVASYAILTALYGISVEKVGFLLSSVIFLFLMLKYVEKQRWKTTLLVTFVCIFASYLLFVYFLRVPLPQGFIKW